VKKERGQEGEGGFQPERNKDEGGGKLPETYKKALRLWEGRAKKEKS